MLEQRRQTYLSLLGIDNYVPRRLLDNAAESALLTDKHFVIPVQPSADSALTDKGLGHHESAIENTASKEQIGQAESAGQTVSSKTAVELTDKTLKEPRYSPLSNMLDSHEDQNAPVKDNIEESKETTIVVQAGTEKELNFIFSVWRIRDQLLVIDTRQPGAAYPTDRLLQNLLRAMGYPLAQLPVSETIRWPLFINKKFVKKNIHSSAEQKNQDTEQARAMVQAYITAQMTKLPFKALLCMGEEAARFSLNEAAEKENQWNIPAVITPSLFSMLQDPLLKAKAWSALQKIIVKNG